MRDILTSVLKIGLAACGAPAVQGVMQAEFLLDGLSKKDEPMKWITRERCDRLPANTRHPGQCLGFSSQGFP